MKALYPEAKILAHPESPSSVLSMADVVGSTSQLIKAACDLPDKTFIVATDQGIFYKLQKAAPNKTFLIAPTAGEGATCRSCANCPWMAMNELELLAEVLERPQGREIFVDPDLAERAMRPLDRMLSFAQSLNTGVVGRA